VNNLECIELENGLKIFLINDNTKHTTYINLIVKYGGIDNEFVVNNKKHVIKNGMAHFIEHLVLESNIYGDLMENFGKMGIKSNGLTSLDRTHYYIDTVDHIYDSLKILIKGIHNPIINEDIINKVRKPILEEKRRSLDNKYSLLYNKSINTVMDNKKFNSVLGELKDIESINESNIKVCLNAFYRPNNEIIIIGGRFDKDMIIETIKNAYNTLTFSNDMITKIREKHRKRVNNKKVIIKTNTGINKTLMTFKLNSENYTPKQKLDLDLYLFCFLKMNFGIVSNLSKEMLNNRIINGGIGFSSTLLEEYNIIRIEVDTDESKIFIKRINEFLKNKEYIYDEELFNLYKRNYMLEIITRNDSIYDTIDPLVENIITFNYEKIDNLDDLDNINFKEFKEYIENIDFSNYSIVELKSY